MNDITISNNKVSLEELSAEQFKAIEKAVLIDDLKDQYKELRLSLHFNLAEEIKMWLDTVNSVHTRRMYFTAMNHFLRFCDNEVLSVGPKEADRYILFLKEDKCSGGTVNLYKNAVSSFYTHLARYDHVSKNPFTASKVKVDSTPKDKYVPTEEEINKVIDLVRQKYSHEIGFMLEMAIRLMKTYGVRIGFLDDIRFEKDKLVSYSKGKVHAISLQNNKADYLYYGLSREVLKNFKSNTIAKYFNDTVKELYEAGEIKGKFSPHCLRHYFACKYYREHGDKNLYDLSQLLGHSSTKVTETYLRSLEVKI